MESYRPAILEFKNLTFIIGTNGSNSRQIMVSATLATGMEQLILPAAMLEQDARTLSGG